MSIYKPISPTDVSSRTEQVYSNQIIDNSTTGVSSNTFVSHSTYFDHPITLTQAQVSESNNYYFIKSNFIFQVLVD